MKGLEIYAIQGRNVMPKKQKKQKTPKKVNRRSKAKYPALDPTLNLRTRYEEIEQNQYINGVKNDNGEIVIRELTHSEKDWLNRFNEEFVNANFNHKGKKIDATKASKKRSYDKNNARNRCIYTKAKASGTLNYIEDLKLTKKQYYDTSVEDKFLKEESDENDGKDE